MNGWQVHDCGWHDHHAPPIGQLFEIVDHIHNFLLKDRDNVVAIHCLAGKGRTGTVIVSYLLYSGLFHDPDEAALFFALRRSNNNWGVTGPSQQRYIRYFWEILRTKRAPNLSTPLRLTAIRMSGPAKFTVGSKRSFSPIIAAVDVSGGLIQHPLWASKGDRTFTDDNEPIIFDLVSGSDAPANPILLFGDINFTVDSWGAFGRKTKFARFAFNTGMVINEHEAELLESTTGVPMASSSMDGSAASVGAVPAQSGPVIPHGHPERIVLRFPKIELDDACSDKRTPDGFVIELVLQRIYTQSWMASNHFLAKPDLAMWNRIFSEYRDTNGVACFKPRQDMSLVQIIAAARALTDARSGEPPKMGGWLTKRGHRVKNWKKRWFALHTNTLEYSKTPKSTTPAGIIQLDDIIAVQEAAPGECEYANAFVIYTNWDDFLCYAQNESDMEEWINTLNLTLQIREQKRELSDATIGQLFVSVLEITNVPTDEYYAVVQLGNHQAKAASTNSFGKELIFDVHQRASDNMVIQLWEENTYLPDVLIGEIQVILDEFQPTKPIELIQWYSFRHQITRVKLKMVYRPKALLEAQRAPAGSSSRPGMVPMTLNTSNTARQANSPSRSATLNSKIVTPAELKELIEILDVGLMESLRAPDMDHPGTDPVWDWSLSSSLSSLSQPAIPRENRYSAMPHFIDQSLPVFMRPISLDIGLPPSDYIPAQPTPGTPEHFLEGKRLMQRASEINPAILKDPVTTETHPTDSSLSPRPYGVDIQSIRHEFAVRAVSPTRNEPKLETSETHRLSGLGTTITAPMVSTSPPQASLPQLEAFNLEHASKTLPATSQAGASDSNPIEHSTLSPSNSPRDAVGESPSPRLAGLPGQKDWKLAASPTSPRSLSPALSPRSELLRSSREPALSAPAAFEAGATANTNPAAHSLQTSSSAFTFTTTTPQTAPSTSGSQSPLASSTGTLEPSTWIPTVAPSEEVLGAFIGETTGKSKAMQSMGNVARERRRNRRPTYDSQHPPEFKSLGLNSSGALTTSSSAELLAPHLDTAVAVSENAQPTSNELSSDVSSFLSSTPSEHPNLSNTASDTISD